MLGFHVFLIERKNFGTIMPFFMLVVFLITIDGEALPLAIRGAIHELGSKALCWYVGCAAAVHDPLLPPSMVVCARRELVGVGAYQTVNMVFERLANVYLDATRGRSDIVFFFQREGRRLAALLQGSARLVVVLISE